MRSTAIALAVLASIALANPASAIEIPELRGHVNDNAGMLQPQERSALEAKLQAYQDQKGHQFVLLTVPSLEGQVIEDFAIKVFDKWKLGDAKADDGLLLIIAPKDRKVRIEVGYGLEGSVPDAIGARVIREVLAPAFQANQYGRGINDAFDKLMLAASGELPAAARDRPRERRRTVGALSPLLLPVLLFIAFAVLSGGGRGGRRRRRGVWAGPFIGGFGGGFGGGGGWGGGGFGGGGGGFSGGGGSSGGGGASGGW